MINIGIVLNFHFFNFGIFSIKVCRISTLYINTAYARSRNLFYFFPTGQFVANKIANKNNKYFVLYAYVFFFIRAIALFPFNADDIVGMKKIYTW